VHIVFDSACYVFHDTKIVLPMRAQYIIVCCSSMVEFLSFLFLCSEATCSKMRGEVLDEVAFCNSYANE
jgi:hypothetical protein